MRGNVERDGPANLRGTRSLSCWVSQCLRIGHFRSSFLTVAPGDVARQGLEEGMVRVLLGLEDVQVALALLAHLTGKGFGKGLDCALLGEVPAALCEEDIVKVVEAGVLRGPDARRPGSMRICFLVVYWWKWHCGCYRILSAK